MTTKKKFGVENPEVVVLNNGRYAFKAPCPWEGKNGKQLVAFKFCSTIDHQNWTSSQSDTPKPERSESEQLSEPEEE